MNKKEILKDYRIAFRSRLCSIIGRKEVLTGKASFGIFGDGIELPQIALTKAMQKGDFRAGYYRDQTIEFALENITVTKFFSQLYADTNVEHDPSSGGRQMNCHFATRFLDENSEFKNLMKTVNTASDISPTAGQMNRLLGLAYASKLYRNEKSFQNNSQKFSHFGDEVVFGSIGDASTSEGVFFEVMNAAGVLQVPLVMSVWDNGYGISVPRHLQTVRDSISKALSGFESKKKGEGFYIYTVKAWDYLSLCKVYKKAAKKARLEHKPVLIHVTEVTQPQGHSTSGSHERYKNKERLTWEKEFDCLLHFKKYILDKQYATEEDLEKIEKEERLVVETDRKAAWQLLCDPIAAERDEAVKLFKSIQSAKVEDNTLIEKFIADLQSPTWLLRRTVQNTLFHAITAFTNIHHDENQKILKFYQDFKAKYKKLYSQHLYNEHDKTILSQEEIKPTYTDDTKDSDGRVVLLKCFEYHFENNTKFFALGEDVGKLGDVNLVFEGLNAKFGDLRVTDTGIRESSILGQGIGCAMRGLRPLVDIQYLDYFLYTLQTASDDLSTLLYRTAAGQKAPVIIRTKGHRLEGVWHTGSPMSVLLGALRGMYVCVPRNMTQAAGMYNTLLQCSNPALVIEVLNGYRLKEKVPNNIGSFTVSLGVPEILRKGSDLTIVTYGACCRVAFDAANLLGKHGVEVEVIDIQTLLPFDTSGVIAKSLEKTNAVLFLDEDVPGGASAYMMREVLEVQNAHMYLDTDPATLTATANRTPYGRDGDYYTKPQVEDVYFKCIEILKSSYPHKVKHPMPTQS